MQGDYLSLLSFTPLRKNIFSTPASPVDSACYSCALKQQMTGGMRLFCSDKSLLAYLRWTQTQSRLFTLDRQVPLVDIRFEKMAHLSTIRSYILYSHACGDTWESHFNTKQNFSFFWMITICQPHKLFIWCLSRSVSGEGSVLTSCR